MTLDITVTDLFCGAGGSSIGAEAAGARLVMAANHWRLAIDTHNTNFPNADHDCADISQVNPRRYPRTDVLIASTRVRRAPATSTRSARARRACWPPGYQIASSAVVPGDPHLSKSSAALSRLAQAAQEAAAALESKTVADHAWSVAQEALVAAWLEVKASDEPASMDRSGVVTLHKRGNTAEQSRANGTAAMMARRAAASSDLTSAAATLRSKSKGTTGQKRTPEQRERMRVAQLASIERRKAAASGTNA